MFKSSIFVTLFFLSCGQNSSGSDDSGPAAPKAEAPLVDKEKPTVVETKAPVNGQGGDPGTDGGPALTPTVVAGAGGSSGEGGSGGGPVPIVVGDDLILPSEALKLSDPFVEWKLNAAKVLTEAPKTVKKSFTFRTNSLSFISYNFEHKSTKDCTGALDFEYALVVEDADHPNGAVPIPLPLDGCLELPGMKSYDVILTMTNSRSCDAIGLEFGLASRNDCRN